MDKVCMYLRKSRADEEIEKTLGEGETLAKHRKTLLKFAKERGLNIVKILEELVSGESIIHRPAMLELLKEVEQGVYDAVLVMDLQRLGRGDMEEQGLILKTFKNSNTKMITPEKTYDLNKEIDETYSEFQAFLSRQEFKLIKSRLQRGKIRSVEDGNYTCPFAPLGYDIKGSGKNRTLVPNGQATIVKMIFDMYVNEGMGGQIIADRLNNMGVKTVRGNTWTQHAVLYIVKNPLYIGKITWKKKIIKKSSSRWKKRDTKVMPQSEWIIAEGKHGPIIDEYTFNKAQEILAGNYHAPAKAITGLTNPLAGLIVCKVCGSKMKYRPYTNVEAHLMCVNKCGNKSSKFKYVESKLLEGLEKWLQNYEIEPDTRKDDPGSITGAYENNVEMLEKELKGLFTQKDKLHDLLEQGVYDIKVFLERSKNITDRIQNITRAVENAKSILELERKRFGNQGNLPSKIRGVLDVYKDIEGAGEKNMLLRDIIEKVEYLKQKSRREDNFEIFIYPKIQ